MKHRIGNDTQCYECKYYVEEEDVRTKQTQGFCVCKDEVRLGINGKVKKNPPDRMRTTRNNCCKYWIDAESGHTKFEVLTGYKEPYDGTKVDFETVQLSMFVEMEK